MSEISILGFDGPFDSYTRSKILKSNKNEKLSGITFIKLMPEEINGKEVQLLELAGIDIAKQLLGEDPDKKIVLIGYYPLQEVEQMRKGFTAFASKKNVVYLNEEDDFGRLLNNLPNKFSKKKDINPKSLYEMITEDNKYIIPRLRHDLNHIKNVEEPTEDEKVPLNETIKRAKAYFPSLKEKTNTEIQEFVNSCKYEVKEVMKGKSIRGVYCDIEGTLLVNGKVNSDTLQKLDTFTTEGKNVTLWTMGDVEVIQETLNKNNISYPLKNKLDFAGAVAEIVLDDEDMNIFIAKTKIQPKTFIKVEEYNL